MKMLRVFLVVLGSLFAFSAVAANQDSWAEGTIKTLDRSVHKATIEHGPIASIGMAAMTMRFTVKDGDGLAKVKVGDRVRFQAVRLDGEVVVTRIEVRK